MSMRELEKEFGTELAGLANDTLNGIPMSSAQLRAAFNDEELKELDVMLKAIQAATGENNKKAALLEHGQTALKLLGELGVAV